MVAQVKAVFRKYDYSVAAIEHSPFSNSVYFQYNSINDKGEVRVSDHEFPNHSHSFYGWDFDLSIGTDAITEMLAELDEELQEKVEER